jgi:hypothetical protein
MGKVSRRPSDDAENQLNCVISTCYRKTCLICIATDGWGAWWDKLLCSGDTEVNLLRLIPHLTVFNIAFLEFFYYIAIIQERNSQEFEICSAAFQYPSF